jgi:hypothetical protein
MTPDHPIYRSRFSSISHRAALIIILSIVFLIFWGLVFEKPSEKFNPNKTNEGGDSAVQYSIIKRIHNGENYYLVAGQELRKFGYPTSSVFNWRLPFLAWILGTLPSIIWAKAILFIIILIALLMWIQFFIEVDITKSILYSSIILLSGTLVFTITSSGLINHELWAGSLIYLSLASYSRKPWYFSIILGLIALFLRELSIIYVGIMAFRAWRENRYSELLLWILGMLIYGFVFGIHYKVVSDLQLKTDLENHWVVFGGWSFVLATAIWNFPLILFPFKIVAVCVPLALMGLIGWYGPIGSRVALTVGGYMIVFLIAGRPDNFYWGLMYAFLLPLGWIQLLFVCKDILGSILLKSR